ncbi:MAG: YegS/Rv2252/BmrU family lipid kinase [Culturomica sp.]|jgi:YegS/Rv2252/BmrU family lipid kinase|nr:YegS/Rv2252/BmrU family lipid kinase [Culturomica sp.]
MELEEKQSKRFLFIVNPISGLGAGKRFPQIVARNKAFKSIPYKIRFTDYSGHASLITREALISKRYTHIIAVGGDGTVNEVGTALYATDIAFGIISLGSGNGLARSWGYSIFQHIALNQLLSDVYSHVDVGEINGRYFLNISGVGYDAEVAHEFNNYKIRGLISYILAGLKLWSRYHEKDYTINCDGNTFSKRCFILSFANSRQYGNNVSIAPKALLTDGFMDICILKRPSFRGILSLLLHFIHPERKKLKLFEEIKYKEAVIEGDISKVHIDGEAVILNSPIILKVHKGALKMIVPPLD